MKKVAVIMGSDSDFPVMKNAVKSLKDMGIPVEAHVLSAHRTPAEAGAFASSARQNGFGVIIAAAGKAAHLAGVLAGHTTLPVIGVPMKASVLDGMDALLATVQMPKGVPVATVAIDGADNAALWLRRSWRFQSRRWRTSWKPRNRKWRGRCWKKTKSCRRKRRRFKKADQTDDENAERQLLQYGGDYL